MDRRAFIAGLSATALAPRASTLAHMPHLETTECRHGQYVRVYGDRLEIERLDFNWGLSLGPDWVVPLPPKSRIRFEVRPVDCFGTTGDAIATGFST